MPEHLLEILKLAPLERYALLSSRENRRKVFACYLAMREKIGQDFMPLIGSKEPYMTDHSRGHLERVLDHAEDILQHCFQKPTSPIPDIPNARVLTWADAVILLNAIVWHDIGNVYGRKKHAEMVTKCFDALRSEALYDEPLSSYVLQVARAHSGPNAIEHVIPASHAVTSYSGDDIHPRFLAATLRFADELDEDHRRSAPHDWERLNLIPEESKRFWYFCKVNSSIKVHNELGSQNIQFWVDIVSHIPTSEFDRKFSFDKGQITALTEYFRRLLKLEAERQYCNKHIRCAYYHPGIAGVRVTLSTHERHTPIGGAGPVSFEFSDDNGVDAFLADENLAALRDHMAEARTMV